MRSLLLSCVAVFVCGSLPAAEPAPTPAPEPKAIDLKNLPVNQWVEQPLTGLKPLIGMSQSAGLCQGLLYVPESGAVVACGDDAAWFKGAVAPKLWRLDLAKGIWATVELPAVANWPRRFEPGMGMSSAESFWGTQACYDPNLKRILGMTSTALALTGKTVEFDWESKAWKVVQYELSPPVLTAASLCYDPVNKESVLATGGFSPVGGTDGTWLYDGKKQQWRRLETPKAMDEVRLPVEKLCDRITALRWLIWKNLEYRCTGREERLDERAKTESLARESAEVLAELKKLAASAETNTAKAERPYHKNGLEAAVRLLTEAAGKLAGLDGKLKTGSPEELEALYRGSAVPAQEGMEKAVAELAVTPEPRMSAKLVYDSKNQLIVCFGGDGQSRAWGDTWVYHCEGRWWERRHPQAHPAPGSSRAMAFDEKNGVTVRLESIVSKGYHTGWRTWCYDASKDEWRALDLDVKPEAFWLEYDREAGCLLAFSHDLSLVRALRLDLGSAKAAEAKASPEVSITPASGEFVLRDAATVQDLRKWKDEQDAWVKSVPANTWVEVPQRGTGRGNWGRTWSSIIYDPDRLQIHYREGGHGSYHGAVTDHYDLPTGRWFRSARRDEPCWPMARYFCWGRSFSGAPWCIHSYKYGLYYNPVTRMLERRGGQPAYDPDMGRWLASPVAAWPDPPKNSTWIPVFGSTDRQVIVPLGRSDSGSGAISVLTTEGWKTSSGHGAFPSVGYPEWEFQTLQHDLKRNRILRMGCGNPANTLWVLDLGAPEAKWTTLQAKAEPDGTPLPESGREMIYLPRHDVFLMPDGAKGKTMTEMCAFDPVGNVWRRFEVKVDANTAVMAKHASGDRSNGLAYDPRSDLIFFMSPAQVGRAPIMRAFRYVPEKKLPGEGERR